MRAGELVVGDERSEVVVDGLSRVQIVMYAGASGDFNPLHTDEVHATEVAGYNSVFAHGQLTMALTATVLTHWVDEAELVAFGVRFRGQVWPGDTLTTTATVTEVSGGAAAMELVTVNQAGQPVVTGYARLRDSS